MSSAPRPPPLPQRLQAYSDLTSQCRDGSYIISYVENFAIRGCCRIMVDETLRTRLRLQLLQLTCALLCNYVTTEVWSVCL